jgi:diguanylate cyclase (GGDEF)-like protein
LLMIDIDHFKAFNDRHGHRAGDDCLRRFAAMLRSVAARASDLAARYGGEEFAVVLPDTDTVGALAVADRLLGLLQNQAIPHGGSPTAEYVTASIGATTYKPGSDMSTWRDSVTHNVSASELVASADRALYDAKRAGRCRVSSRPILSAHESDCGTVGV